MSKFKAYGIESIVQCSKLNSTINPFKKEYKLPGHYNCAFCKYDPLKNPTCSGYEPVTIYRNKK